MVRVEQRCLLGSAGFHVALLLLVLLAPKISTTTTTTSPVLTIIPTDLKVTDGDKIGGGSPDAKPPAQSPIPRTAPVATPEPPKPISKPLPTPKPEPLPEPEKVEKIEKKAPSKPKEKAAPVEPEKKINTDVPSQDTAPTVKKPKKTIKTSDAIKTSDTPKKFNREELAAQRREAEEAEAEREAERAADARRRARAAQIAEFNAERARIAGAIGGAASVVGKSLAGSAGVTMPGPGGQAYAPYRSYLAAFYKERWRNKPSAIPANSPGVMVEIVIARDGRLVEWHVTQGSGSRELDQSVKDLIPRYPKLLPLPEGSTDPQRTFRVLFTLEADTPS
jgi:TonB family protein